MRRLAAAAATCLLMTPLAAAGWSDSVPPPRLVPATGWVVAKPGRSEPYVGADAIVAVTQPDAARVLPFAPFVGFTHLSKTGTIIWAITIGRGRPGFPRAHLPLRLSSFRVDHGWEGQPAGNIQQRLRWVAVGGWDLDVRVYFATQHPTRRLLSIAQAELDLLLLPRG